jgi:hypothetical protein
MVEPLPLTESFEADWYEYVPHIHNAADFLAACQTKTLAQPNQLKTWAQGEILAHSDPISGLADYLHALAQKQPVPVSLKTNLKNIYRRWRSPYRKSYFNPRTHENDTFDDDDVNRKTAAWGKVL